MSAAHTTVTLYVDPACPWAWLTSRWLAEVATVRPVGVVTRLFDLAEKNREDDKGDERRLKSHSAGERALRVLAVAGQEHGDGALARVYTEIGEAHHERGEDLGDLATLGEAVRRAGLDPDLADRALADESTLDLVLRQHREACETGAFGVPTLCLDDQPCIFGPVVDRRVTGEEAGELWDHTEWLIRHGFFFELKRTRTRRADVGRYRMAHAAA